MITIHWGWLFAGGWVLISIGFVLGAAWCGLGIKNKKIDAGIKDAKG